MRRCRVGTRDAVFHGWFQQIEGGAVALVEYGDGTADQVCSGDIKFLDKPSDELRFEATTRILAGILASNPVGDPTRHVYDAIRFADETIKEVNR